MAAPSKTFTDIADGSIDVDSPINTDLFTFLRDNIIHTDERIGIPVAPANRQANHRHGGLGVDGSDLIELTPQENLVAGTDGIVGFTDGPVVTAGGIAFQREASGFTPRRITRSTGGATHRDYVEKFFVGNPAIEKKIKSSGGKGRFTCSVFAKREAAASGVVGGTMRFGVLGSGGFSTGGFVDVIFDEFTTEYQRFFFVSNQITRQTALRIRIEWIVNPSDFDTISNGDLMGHIGGVMVNNGAGLAKWDISHLDGGADTYLSAPTDDIIHWWDEVITTVQKTP